MPINAHPEYLAAESEYLKAGSTKEKILTLKKMISLCPSHKGAERLRAQLKTRLKKLVQEQEKSGSKKGATKKGIKKAEMQAVIVGKSNSGKSSLLNILTNQDAEISEFLFTTKSPQIGMFEYANTQIQIIENPAIDSEFYDRGLTNSADTILIIATNINEIEEIKKQIPENKFQKQIIIFNKSDLLDSEQKRKLDATLCSKKYNYVLVSTKTSEGIEEVKGKIFQSFSKIRVFTKEPNKKNFDSTKPVILLPGSTIKDVAEKILHGFSKKVKQTKLWGPSSKFPGQIVGLQHELKDSDVVEFKTE